jgi:hypothetical protein
VGKMEDIIIYGSAGLSFLCLLLLLINSIRLSKLSKKYKLLIKGLSDKDVENLMISYSEEMYKVKNDIEDNMKRRIKALEDKIPSCFRHFGMTTYNAFENIGNNMSFSIAALNDKKDGFLITGIYTRENSYVYAKEIINGISNKELSEQEKEALNKALIQNECVAQGAAL